MSTRGSTGGRGLRGGWRPAARAAAARLQVGEDGEEFILAHAARPQHRREGEIFPDGERGEDAAILGTEAEAEARSVDGVVRVINNLQVKSPPTS